VCRNQLILHGFCIQQHIDILNLFSKGDSGANGTSCLIKSIAGVHAEKCYRANNNYCNPLERILVLLRRLLL
jgi:hypothetical protein